MSNAAYGMSGNGLTPDQVEGLVSMMDEANGQSKAAMERPQSQVVGYSLRETEDPEAKETGSKHAVSANSNPGAIYIPETVKDKNVLPTPSTKLKTGTEAKKNKPKPKGDDIWAAEEIDQEVNYMPTNKQKPVVVEASDTTANTAVTSSSSQSASTPAAASSSARATPAATDKRIVPDYDILYKQTNTAEDVYLSMDFERDGSTAMSCEGLAVHVKMPLLDDVKDVELDIDPFLMTLRSRDYLLKVNLPERCVAKKGSAKWDPAKKVLAVHVVVDQSDKKVKVM